MRGLYPIVDLDQLAGRGLDPLLLTRTLLSVHPPLLQLRAKSASPRETLSLLKAMRPLCSSAGTWLFANDRPDLALAAECDGVHVGQEDLPVAEVRRFAPSLKVGVSTHTEEQLREALGEHPDYVAYGPIFSTRSKENPDAVVGLRGLEIAAGVARAAGCPLVAIGGIDADRAATVARHADLVAVISALVPVSGDREEVRRRAEAFHGVTLAGLCRGSGDSTLPNKRN